MLTRALFIVIAVAAAVFYMATRSWGDDHLAVRLAFKAVPVLLLMTWVQMSLPTSTNGKSFARLLQVGLLLCVIGDVVLDLHFVGGLAAFLCGHLLYVAAFFVGKPPLRLAWFVPFALWGGGVAMWAWPGMVEKNMAGPVAFYIAVITVMMWRSCARMGRPITRAQWLGFLGAFLFGLSDSFIAVRMFIADFALAKYGILAYWSGQWGIAASAAFYDDN